MSPPTHEDPILVELPRDANAGRELAAFCASPVVHHFLLPPVWALEGAGIDLAAARPDIRTITVESLPEAVDGLTTLCDPQVLDALVARRWAEVDEMVRDFYLKRTTLQTLAAIFKMAPKSVQRDPPALFRREMVYEQRFEVQYRLARGDLPASPLSPPEEGSLVYYPFDPADEGGREEGGLDPGSGVVLEAFAYGPARRLHVDALIQIGRDHGWRVLDPQA